MPRGTKRIGEGEQIYLCGPLNQERDIAISDVYKSLACS